MLKFILNLSQTESSEIFKLGNLLGTRNINLHTDKKSLSCLNFMNFFVLCTYFHAIKIHPIDLRVQNWLFINFRPQKSTL